MESSSGLIIDETAKETPKQSAAAGLAMQSASAVPSAAALATGGETPIDVQGVEEDMEPEVALDLTVPTPESERAMAVSSPTPTPISIYPTVVSASSVPSIPTTTSCTITNCNAKFPNPAIRLYALSLGPHPASTAP